MSLDALALADEAVGFYSLPDLVTVMIFARLPLDTRLRAREVSPAWCALLEDASLWMHVDLSASCRVNPCFLHPCLLHPGDASRSLRASKDQPAVGGPLGRSLCRRRLAQTVAGFCVGG